MKALFNHNHALTVASELLVKGKFDFVADARICVRHAGEVLIAM